MGQNKGKSFRDKTKDGLDACGEWLKANSDALADAIADGCTHWEVAFVWNTMTDDPFSFPHIDVNINKVSKDIIEAYR